MAIGSVLLAGPDSMAFDTYAVNSIAPGTGIGYGPALRYPRMLGTQLILQDGRKFRFANTQAATVVGDVQQSMVVLTTDANLSAVAGVVGDRSISFTHGAATEVLNYIAEGFVTVNVTPGGGHSYKIANHAAFASGGGPDTVNLWPGHALRAALTTTTSKLYLIPHPCDHTLVMAATITGSPVGVAVSVTATATPCAWLQTAGLCNVSSAASVLIGGTAVMLLTGGTAGAVAPASAATQPVVGYVVNIGASAGWSVLNLKLDA